MEKREAIALLRRYEEYHVSEPLGSVEDFLETEVPAACVLMCQSLRAMRGTGSSSADIAEHVDKFLGLWGDFL